MRRMILSMMVSLDGLTARPDGDLGWFLSDARFEDEMLSLLRGVDAMMFGRVSYQLLADYWPKAGKPGSPDAPGGFTSEARANEFARLMNSIPKVVFSRTLPEATWGPATLVRENIAEEVARMKARPGKDLVLFAGAGLASTFMNLDLVDEFRLMVHPVVLGRGIALFDKVEAELPLKLLKADTFPSGVVLLRYERDRAR
jgi:dihydrofolate reductase